MPGIQKRSFSSPDETRTPDKTKVDVLHLGNVNVARITLQPGWKWSQCVKPVAKTESCQARHVGTCIRGRMHVVHGDGTTMEIGPGEAYVIEPGHDAWVLGNEPLVAFEFESKTAAEFAKG